MTRQRLGRTLLGVGLAASLTCNVLVAFRYVRGNAGASSAGNLEATEGGSEMQVVEASEPRLPPQPKILSNCSAEVESLRQRIELVEESISKSTPLPALYDAARSANASLTTEFRQHVALPPGIDLDCRENVCQLTRSNGETGPLGDVRDTVATNEWITRNADRVMPGWTKMFVSFRDTDEALGLDVLASFVKELYQSRLIDSCAARWPPEEASLGLEAKVIPRYDLGNESGSTRIMWNLHGRLVGSEFGRCVSDELAKMVEQFPLPEKASFASFENVGIWPSESQQRFRRLAGGFDESR